MYSIVQICTLLCARELDTQACSARLPRGRHRHRGKGRRKHRGRGRRYTGNAQQAAKQAALGSRQDVMSKYNRI